MSGCDQQGSTIYVIFKKKKIPNNFHHEAIADSKNKMYNFMFSEHVLCTKLHLNKIMIYYNNEWESA